tara:strand:+ start:128 stop:1231 length:1104 start_codon:yes stop_codon:yes gene_type:complete
MKKISLTFLLILTTIISCNEASEEISGPSYDRGTLLNNWYNFNIQPRLSEFKSKLDIMEAATKEFKIKKDNSSLNDLRQKYIDAHMSWQRVEMINIGKAEEIYYNSKMNVYPVNTARVTANITSGTYDFNNANNNAAQGFPTIDYMLYGLDESDEKIIEVYANDDNYANYLSDVTENMKNITNDVVGSWETYKTVFVNSTDNTATSAFNIMVNDFLFYYEKSFRANKIGIPGGVFSTGPIPENVEGYYSRINSKKFAEEAYKGIIEFYEGKEHRTENYYSGATLKSIISDLDENTGDNNLGNKISNKMTIALQKITDLDDNFVNQIETNNTKLLQTYDAIQEIVVLLKVDMLQLLSVTVDYIDADGD